MPRYTRPAKPRHDPLHVEIEADSTVQKFGRVSKPGRRKAREEDEEGVDGVRKTYAVLSGACADEIV